MRLGAAADVRWIGKRTTHANNLNMHVKHLRTAAILAAAASLAATHLEGQSFQSYPAGDDVTTSLGQFQVTLDPSLVKVFDAIMANSPLNNILATKHLKIYRHGVFTSPTLYDPATTIGRSDPLVSGSPLDTDGVLAGSATGRTYISDAQLTVPPAWGDAPSGVNEVHTFIKSMNLADSFTTRVGFAVKAGMQAPTRPVSAGEVQAAGNGTNDFPANSFFNVFVEVDLPGGGILPAIQLVNVDPLLVQHTNILSFPPQIIYQHGNSTAVSLYFNNDVTIPDPTGGPDIHATRGTLFGQLTLAGHGVGFGEAETEAFQNEIENESQSSSMPINSAPATTVQVEDFAPDYGALPPSLQVPHFTVEGAFVFTAANVRPNIAIYIQRAESLAAKGWITIGTNKPQASAFDFSDPSPGISERFYRLSPSP